MKKQFQFKSYKVKFAIEKQNTSVDLSNEMKRAKQNLKLIVLPGKWFSVEEYFKDLVAQLENDIYPLFRSTKGGAPFTVIRNSLCFVDHMSQLLYGNKGPQNIRLTKVISELGSVDPYLNTHYRLYAPYLIQLYRHDLVHNLRPLPKSLTIIDKGNSRVAESWFFNATMLDGRGFGANYSEMKTQKGRKGRNHLRYIGDQIYIDTFSIFFDTVIFIDEQISKITNDSRFETKVINNYYKILKNSYSSLTNFKLDLSDNKEARIF